MAHLPSPLAVMHFATPITLNSALFTPSTASARNDSFRRGDDSQRAGAVFWPHIPRKEIFEAGRDGNIHQAHRKASKPVIIHM
ncbi:hypothetical protein P175DRAFT_0531568 [Aspergillus ochraceoroseus IBT 24754]|uniref:Uncharacterized protein n=1 Tax=Aspergillus ochraceoroseus IBT 24754 TaxID=1392256 RepID=A0A2T5M0G0_9EURO|nr:uncharacterized protein P175DRAFT_0531568 [Aspergillus ochraceoroseus IBT 24754]PTU22021.1 hypothetical protein P175DRAFT_0531568 [Aspergillus ochraceoroseus IBT 24754]